MNSTDFRTMSNVRLQIDLERRLAKRRAAEAKRAARFGRRSERDNDASLPVMFMGALAVLALWALYGWAVVSVTTWALK